MIKNNFLPTFGRIVFLGYASSGWQIDCLIAKSQQETITRYSFSFEYYEYFIDMLLFYYHVEFEYR